VVTVRRILYVQYTDPAHYPPLEHSSRLFAERGWEVLMLGTGTENELNLQLPSHPRIRIKKVGFVQRGWRQKIQYIFFILLTLYWTWWWRPSWIYASDPMACPVVWLVQKLINVRVAYHEHDSPVEGCAAQSWFMKSVLAFHKKIGREAAICILPQQDRMLRFLALTARTTPTFCVWNCPRKTEVIPALVVSDTPIIVYYHGNVSQILLPIATLTAISRFRGKVRLRVAGYETIGNEGYLAELCRLTEDAPSLIESLGTLRRADLFRAASAAHVGLCVMPKSTDNINLSHMVGASNKAFDYMACGLPLLVTDLPEWVTAFVEPGYARACNPDDPDSIEAALRWYLDHPEERREMGRRCRKKIEQTWNYETVFAEVLEKIEND